MLRKLFPDRLRNRAVGKGIEVLKSKDYEFVKKLGDGTYGDVISLRKADGKSKVAAKIVLQEKVTNGEIQLWPLFQHPNVLALLETIELPNINVYLMPLHEITLSGALRKKCFTENSLSFYYTKLWLGDILKGLEYLHNSKICHLDLKEDNVLIASDMRAVISDFSFAASTYDGMKFCGLPQQLAAPETSRTDYIDGIAFDVWSFGILALSMWTNRWYQKRIRKLWHWEKNIYPFIFESVQFLNFASHLKRSFPRAKINKMDRVLAHNLVLGILRYDAVKRPSVSTLHHHPLFDEAESSKSLLDPDNIWIDKYFEPVSEHANDLNASSTMDSHFSKGDASKNLGCANDFKIRKKKESLGKRIRKWFRKRLYSSLVCN